MTHRSAKQATAAALALASRSRFYHRTRSNAQPPPLHPRRQRIVVHSDYKDSSPSSVQENLKQRWVSLWINRSDAPTATVTRGNSHSARLLPSLIAIHRKFQTRHVAEDSTRLYGEATQHRMRLSVDGYTQHAACRLHHCPRTRRHQQKPTGHGSNAPADGTLERPVPQNLLLPYDNILTTPTYTSCYRAWYHQTAAHIGGRIDRIRQLCLIRLFGDSSSLYKFWVVS